MYLENQHFLTDFETFFFFLIQKDGERNGYSLKFHKSEIYFKICMFSLLGPPNQQVLWAYLKKRGLFKCFIWQSCLCTYLCFQR